MFDGHYLAWNNNKIKTIIDHYGYKSFMGKTVLDLGCGYGDIGAALSRLGAVVTGIDARQEHLDIAKRKYPHINFIKHNLENGLPFKNKFFDFIISIGTANHLKNIEKHIIEISKITNNLILETEICDSLDDSKIITYNESKQVYDWSFSGHGCAASSKFIEKLLYASNMSFYRCDNQSLNTDNFKYDWQETNSGNRVYGNRRFWFAKRELKLNKNINKNKIITPSLMEGNALLEETLKSADLSIVEKINSGKFKTALCLSGHMRTFESTYNYLKRYILDITKCDIFIHTWDIVGFDFNRGDGHLTSKPTVNYKQKIINMYNPKKIIIEPQKQFNILRWKQTYTVRDPNTIIGMYYKIKMVNELKKEYEQENNFNYDCVIRCRPDLLFETPININDFKDLSSLHVPTFGWYNGLNDQFAFGDSKTMDVYASCFDYIYQYSDMGVHYHPETILKHHINYWNVPIKTTNINYIIQRVNGTYFRNG